MTSQSAVEEVILQSSKPILDGEDVVDFRLLYSGELPARGDATQKHAIRREFHVQLKELWSSQRNLRELAADKGLFDVLGARANAESFVDPAVFHKSFNAGIAKMAENWEKFGFKWLPLVTKEMCLRCSLDILVLRREKPNRVFMKGDIDARIKTLFDAFRMPEQKQEILGAEPGEGEDPFHVLLQDDDLIADVRLTTDQLLSIPRAQQYESNFATMIVRVKLQTSAPGPLNWAFEH